MTDLNSRRRGGVKILRSVAKACGVPLVRDDASRDKVRSFFSAIEAAKPEESELEKARTA